MSPLLKFFPFHHFQSLVQAEHRTVCYARPAFTVMDYLGWLSRYTTCGDS